MQQFLAKYEQVKAAKGDTLKGFIILNKFSGKTKLDKEVVEALHVMEVKVMESKLAERVVYKEAPISGLGVYEMKNEKAKDEINLLVQEVEQIIKSFIK